ncbi:MAG: hypothetical protein JWQ27_1030 [Ferruginibacter sp.]|nr:hypothetical protein [Ferruginibacter sp.]
MAIVVPRIGGRRKYLLSINFHIYKYQQLWTIHVHILFNQLPAAFQRFYTSCGKNKFF